MKFKKYPLQIRLLICIGLLMVTTPTLINDWFPLPHFVRGALVGVGLGLEISGLIKINRLRKTGASC
ncbi:hypothetical protein [Mucilaginibacter sp. L196]|uniref:hypothetical protein n=1 Tax=Mucilaginibacter sp. L196 TaxID=1641870 RepID=UPI00131D85AC|nr:hypothetical protein [Mucilaginibacter sp. L196]